MLNTLRKGRRAATNTRIAQLFPQGFAHGVSGDDIQQQVAANQLEEAMMIRRLARHPEWRPPMQVDGLDMLRQHLSTGGVMLWACPQRFNMLLTSLMAHDAGLTPVRLSQWSHGPAATETPTDFAQKHLNLPWQAVENRFAGRLEIGRDGVRRPMAEFGKRLNDAALIIVNAIPLSRGPATVPVPNGQMQMATGSARVALRSGASIFATHLHRDGQGRFTLTCTMLSDRAAPLTRDALTARMVAQSHAAIHADPGLWILQSTQLQPTDSPEPGATA